MVEILGPEGDLCAGIAHAFQAINADNCLTIEWIVLGTPDGVDFENVQFSSPYSLFTDITVPVVGEYSFAVRCREPA